MDKKVCLDTDVIIAILNKEERASILIERIKECEVFTTTINVFELFLRETNIDALELFREKVQVLEFDEIAARKSSTLFKILRKKGRLIEIRDLFIASLCVTRDCSLATFNKKHFLDIEGLDLV